MQAQVIHSSPAKPKQEENKLIPAATYIPSCHPPIASFPREAPGARQAPPGSCCRAGRGAGRPGGCAPPPSSRGGPEVKRGRLRAAALMRGALPKPRAPAPAAGGGRRSPTAGSRRHGPAPPGPSGPQPRGAGGSRGVPGLDRARSCPPGAARGQPPRPRPFPERALPAAGSRSVSRFFALPAARGSAELDAGWTRAPRHTIHLPACTGGGSEQRRGLASLWFILCRGFACALQEHKGEVQRQNCPIERALWEA